MNVFILVSHLHRQRASDQLPNTLRDRLIAFLQVVDLPSLFQAIRGSPREAKEIVLAVLVDQEFSSLDQQ